MKLNDLIPQLQRLVSENKLGTTAAEQLAYLTPEVQSTLYETLGEEIGEKTVAEVKDSLDRLKEVGLIRVERRADARGFRTSNVYYLLEPPSEFTDK